jgi:hypothetical protein
MVDKSKWGDGPWQKEPNQSSFVETNTGYHCYCVREMHAGHWCGYVRVPRSHSWYGFEEFTLVPVSVHGGLTWSRNYSPFKPAKEGGWYFGFDCGHGSRDYQPGRVAFFKSLGTPESEYDPTPDAYRDLNYVREQCLLVAVQLKALGS